MLTNLVNALQNYKKRGLEVKFYDTGFSKVVKVGGSTYCTFYENDEWNKFWGMWRNREVVKNG